MIMKCPCCNKELVDYDGKALIQVGTYLSKLINPMSLVINMITGLKNIGKTIYYDFSNIPQTDEYLYCPQCSIYFIICCHCGHLNCIRGDIIVSPKKITCNNCKQEYVYATHPDHDVDHGF